MVMTTQPPAQELPELPKNVQHIMRRIRACEGEEAARIVLEHALREYGRACIAASQAGRAEPVGEGFFMPDGTFSGSASKRLGYLRLLPEDAASGCTVRPLYATPPLEGREAMSEEQLQADALKFGTTVEYQRERHQWAADVSAMAQPRIKRTNHG